MGSRYPTALGAVFVVMGLLALSQCPPAVQTILGLAAVAVLVARLYGAAPAPPRARTARILTASHETLAPGTSGPAYSERFADAAGAIDLVARALSRRDPSKAGELGGVLDRCCEEYMRALSGARGAMTSYLLARDEVRGVLDECYIAGGEAAVPDLDRAVARSDALFQSFERVLHLAGRADRPGPTPAVAA